MVKKLIEGFLKRYGDKKGPSNNIPDELPPLGEEAAAPASAPAPASPQQEEAKGEGAEPPEELPSLGLEGKKPEVVEFRHVIRPAPSPEEPASFKRELHKAEENASEEDMLREELQKEKEKEHTKGVAEGFFAGISKMLKEGKPVDSLISHDLVANMKESWSIRKESSRTGLSSSEEKRITTAITETLAQLRLMESKWRAHKMILDEYEKLSKEQEDKIKEKENELKALLKKFRIYQHVPDDKVIMLKDSIPIRSVSDAVNALRTMDVPTFNAYVNSRRNEFSRLASCIDKKLGEDLKKAATKPGMLSILEAFVKKLSE